jgi:G3E family GTPase
MGGIIIDGGQFPWDAHGDRFPMLTQPVFERVVVETTGLADPAPMVNSLIPGGAPDLLSTGERADSIRQLSETLRNLNPTAHLIARQDDGFDSVSLIGAGSYPPTDKPEDVIGWLALERADPQRIMRLTATGIGTSKRCI